MKFGKAHWIGMIFAVVILAVAFLLFLGDDLFFFLMGIALVIFILPFVAGVVLESQAERDKSERFLEFSRNLAESVKSGTPIGQSIINMRNKNFGNLSPHVEKLANQISLGIPINRAFQTFAKDIESGTIQRAVTLIREAENAGGHIDNILDSVAKSMYQIEKLRKERKAAIYNLVVQGYIIFFIFIGIMLVMQFKVLPLTADVGGLGEVGDFEGVGGNIPTVGGAVASPEQLGRPFLFLLLVQGIFTGFTVGKLAEGSIKAGIKHSFILAIAAFLVSTGASVFLG
jgi:archaeal flagellar protein FlaJ